MDTTIKVVNDVYMRCIQYEDIIAICVWICIDNFTYISHIYVYWAYDTHTIITFIWYYMIVRIALITIYKQIGKKTPGPDQGPIL